MTPCAARFSVFIDAPRGAVYRALLDPRSIAAWKVPDGMSSRVHELPPGVSPADNAMG